MTEKREWHISEDDDGDLWLKKESEETALKDIVMEIYRQIQSVIDCFFPTGRRQITQNLKID